MASPASPAFSTATGRLMFPPGTAVMDIRASADRFTDPVGRTLELVGDQLSATPTVSTVSPRARLPTAASLPDGATLAEEPGAVRRPNGEMYVPRDVKAGGTTMQDIAMCRLAYAKKIPVLLYGPPGTGKTALGEAALENLVTLAGSGDTEVADFIGGYVQNPDGTFTWVDGPLIRCMENGWPLLIDEVALIDTKVMAVVYSVMDGRDELNVSANPARGTVKAVDGFYVMGACNPDVPGAVMSEALMSRFLMHIEVLTDYDLATKLGVPREIVVVAKNLKRKQDASEILKAPQMRELLGFKKIADAFGLNPALANFISIAEPGDRPAYKEMIKSTFSKDIDTLSIG